MRVNGGSLTELGSDHYYPYDVNEASTPGQLYVNYEVVLEYLERAKEPEWLAKMQSTCDKIIKPETIEPSTENNERLLLSSENSVHLSHT